MHTCLRLGLKALYRIAGYVLLKVTLPTTRVVVFVLFQYQRTRPRGHFGRIQVCNLSFNQHKDNLRFENYCAFKNEYHRLFAIIKKLNEFLLLIFGSRQLVFFLK